MPKSGLIPFAVLFACLLLSFANTFFTPKVALHYLEKEKEITRDALVIPGPTRSDVPAAGGQASDASIRNGLPPMGGVASDFEGAVSQYVQALLATEDFRDRWRPSSWEEFSKERNDPDGGYLFHFELLFDSGADKLVFIASDRFGSQNCPSWNVYASSPSGWTQVASGEIINVETLYVDTLSRTIVQRYPERFGPGMNYSTLSFGTDGSVQKAYYRIEETDAVTQEILARLGTPFVPVVKKIPIAAYFGSPGLAWRSLDRSHSVSAQSLDAGDTEILARFGKMDLSRAIRFAELLDSDSSRPSGSQTVVPRSTSISTPGVSP